MTLELIKNVLLVDDNEKKLREYAAILTSLGCVVTIAPNEDEAWKEFERAKKKSDKAFRLVITDVAMPDVHKMAGLSLARKIRKAQKQPHVYIYVITQHLEEELYVKAWEARVDGFLFKSSSAAKAEWWSDRISEAEIKLREKDYAAVAITLEANVLDNLIGESECMKDVKKTNWQGGRHKSNRVDSRREWRWQGIGR